MGTSTIECPPCASSRLAISGSSSPRSSSERRSAGARPAAVRATRSSAASCGRVGDRCEPGDLPVRQRETHPRGAQERLEDLGDSIEAVGERTRAGEFLGDAAQPVGERAGLGLLREEARCVHCDGSLSREGAQHLELRLVQRLLGLGYHDHDAEGRACRP